MWFEVALGLGLGVTYYPRTGEFAAKLSEWVKDKYEDYLKPSVDRFRGVRPPFTVCNKVSDNLFQFSPVTIIQSDGLFRKFTVKVTVRNPNMRVAALEFSNWRTSPDITVAITDDDRGGREVGDESEDYERVLRSLDSLPLFLNSKNVSPLQRVKDIPGTWELLGLARKFIGGEWTGHYFVDPVKGELPVHYGSEAFLDKVIFAAVEEQDEEMLERYYEKIESGLRTELEIIDKKVEKKKAVVEEVEIAKVGAKRRLIIGSIIAALLLILIIALLFIPGGQVAAGVLSLVTAVAQGVMTAVGALSKTEAVVKVAAIGALAVGIQKTVQSYKQYEGVLAEARITEFEQVKQEVESVLEATLKMKNKMSDVLKAVKSLDSDTLDLVGQELASTQMKIIRESFRKGLPDCTSLVLAENEITASGAAELSEILRYQTSLRTLDVADNSLGEDGVGILHDGLQYNFTLADLHYDRAAVAQDLQDKITGHLNMARYLHGVELIGDAVEADVRAALLKKLKENYTVTAIAGDIREDLRLQVEAVLTQNRLFAQLSSQSPAAREQITDNFVRAFQIDSARCFAFLNESSAGMTINGIWGDIRSNEANILKLLMLDTEKRERLLRRFSVGREDSLKKADLVLFVMDIRAQIPQELIQSSPEFAAFARSFVNEAFVKLPSNGVSYESMKEAFERQRIALAGCVVAPEFAGAKRKALQSLTLALNAELRENPLLAKQRQLQHLVEDNPASETTLNDFVILYEQIEPKDFAACFENIDRGKLMKLLRVDVYNPGSKQVRCAQLRGMDYEHRKALLEHCFSGEEYADSKAILVSRMMEIDMLFDFSSAEREAGILRNELYNAFSWPRLWGIRSDSTPTGFITLGGMLDRKRQELITKESCVTAAMLDGVLQAEKQAELMKDNPCLRGEHFEAEEFEALKREFEDDEDLRYFDFSVGVKEEVRVYVEHIIARNKLYDFVWNYPTSLDTLKQFLAVYKTIDIEEAYNSLEHISYQERLVELVKKGMWDYASSKAVYDELGVLDEDHRISLLEHCFKAEDKAWEKAVFVSAMMDIPELRDGEDRIAQDMRDKCLAYTFPWKLSSAYNYESLKRKVEILRRRAKTEESVITPEMADLPLQAVLQADLMDRYDCLQGEVSNPVKMDTLLTVLTRELAENFELRQPFQSYAEGVDPAVKALIDTTVKRNQLRDLTFNYPVSVATLDKVLTVYKTVSTEMCAACFAEMGRASEITQLIKKDIYDDRAGRTTCTRLREFDLAHRTELLAHCFAGENNSRSKAVLAANIMEIGALFEVDNQADQVVKDVLESYLVYIVPWSFKAYDFNGLRAKLQEVRDRLESGYRRYRETPEPLKEAVMVGIDKALKAADVQRLKEAEVVMLDVPFRGFFQRQHPPVREEQRVASVEPRHDV